MPSHQLRFDNLPMNRQVGNQATPKAPGGQFAGGQALQAVYEKRDIDPVAMYPKRREGSRRSVTSAPNLLGITVDVNKGRVEVDKDFTSDLTSNTWVGIATVRITAGAAEDSVCPILNLQGLTAQIEYSASANQYSLVWRFDSDASAQQTLVLGAAGDYRIAMGRNTASSVLGKWGVDNSGYVLNTLANATGYQAENNVTLFGERLTDSAGLDDVIVTNFLFYDVIDFSEAEFKSLAADLTPATSGTNAASTAYKLLWHETFENGGDILSYTDSTPAEIDSYLVPTNPAVDGLDITFGGKGVIEVPFYFDFDEYYWTPVNASARYDWMFQVELTLPTRELIDQSCVFDFQDICQLKIRKAGANYYFQSVFADGGGTTNTQTLTAGGSYTVFVGRNADNYLIQVVPSGGAPVDASSAAGNPAIFNYDQTLNFLIGDRANLELTSPFGGKIRRFALHNKNTYGFGPISEAVLYYDSSSVYGDQILDRGNRALSGYLGTRVSSTPPYYREGAFPGGSYVAATGGYVMASSTPSTGYTGELRKAITKDAVVQRRGDKAFLTSNGVSYVLNDFDQSYRPLGIPRPGTKVTCTPQGVGPIDGFVRYGYRYVTKDGTVGPAFDLDPVDARNGVNVFLGADGFGLPGEAPFGISYGECEGYKTSSPQGLTGSDAVEHFLFKDTDGGSNHNLLYKDTGENGLTLETAFRLPDRDSIKESIFSQGVDAPSGVTNWVATNNPASFPWIGQAQQECCFQFAFRFDGSSNNGQQILFGIGAPDQHYETGWFNNDHYRLNHLIVSIQHAESRFRTHSLAVCRDNPTGSNHRDNDLVYTSVDFDFIDGRDYSVFVRRGSEGTEPQGTSLILHIYDHTAAKAGQNGWAQWPDGNTQQKVADFWPVGYSGDAWDRVTWGGCRREGSSGYAIRTRTRYRNANSGSIVWENFDAFRGGGRMYHGRMWRRDFSLAQLEARALDRYGAREGILAEDLEIDVAFSPDSSKDTIEGGWDVENEIRVKFYNQTNSHFSGVVALTDNTEVSPVMCYGYDMSQDLTQTPDNWFTTSLDKVPMWIAWSSRNEGSLSIGVGSKPLVEIATRKWHSASEVQTFDEFAGAIDLDEFTWVTLYYSHKQRSGTSSTIYDIFLERVFIDGNTGAWGDVFENDPATALRRNDVGAATGDYQYGLFTLGGLPGADQKYEVEFAEVRLWDGERYAAEGGGDGPEAFGPYISSRVPPNDWPKMWYYGRFMKADVNDTTTPTLMTQVGQFVDSNGNSQKQANAVDIERGATVLDALLDSASTTSQYFVPFPEPPLSSIRGIQIFRTQIVPVVDEFQSGVDNPNALSDAWRACRDAPLYFLTEIPRGNTSYIDTATDGVLGSKLDATTGLVPRNPGGIFEWSGYLGIFDADEPRIYFAESPSSWESFPLENLYDLPVREEGAIRAAIELASRDARNSRVLCLGKSFGVFLDGSPIQPQANTLGGGVGAWSQRCLVAENGIAYAYNGTLWAITGSGQVEDIGIPVLDLLPKPDYARLSVSSTLGSLLVIDEETGLVLRFHFARRQWYVEDRNALSCTDVDGVDNWVHLSGYPSQGTAGCYQDDVGPSTPAGAVAVNSWNNAANTLTMSSVTGIAVGMRLTVVFDRQTGNLRLNPAIRQTVTVASIAGNIITTEEDLDIQTSWTALDGVTYSVRLNAYVGVGYWGTLIDTGSFKLKGDLKYVDVGVDQGDDWWASVESHDFAKDPADRTGVVGAETAPTHLVDDGGSGTSLRWGLNNNQRFNRVLVWSPTGSPVGLTELELNYTVDPGEDS